MNANFVVRYIITFFIIFFFFMLSYYRVAKPYTFIVVGPTDEKNWFKDAKKKIKTVKDKIKKNNPTERFELFPNFNFRKRDYDRYFSLYDYYDIATFLSIELYNRHKQLQEKINILCYGKGVIIAALAIIKLGTRVQHNIQTFSADNSMETLEGTPPESPIITSYQIPQNIEDKITEDEYFKIIHLMNLMRKIDSEKVESNSNLIAVSTIITAVITCIIGPIIAAIITI